MNLFDWMFTPEERAEIERVKKLCYEKMIDSLKIGGEDSEEKRAYIETIKKELLTEEARKAFENAVSEKIIDLVVYGKV